MATKYTPPRRPYDWSLDGDPPPYREPRIVYDWATGKMVKPSRRRRTRLIYRWLLTMLAVFLAGVLFGACQRSSNDHPKYVPAETVEQSQATETPPQAATQPHEAPDAAPKSMSADTALKDLSDVTQDAFGGNGQVPDQLENDDGGGSFIPRPAVGSFIDRLLPQPQVDVDRFPLPVPPIGGAPW